MEYFWIGFYGAFGVYSAGVILALGSFLLLAIVGRILIALE